MFQENAYRTSNGLVTLLALLVAAIAGFGVLLTSATSFVIQQQIYEWNSREAETTYRNERIRRTFMFVEEALRPYPQAEWPARFDALAHRMGSPARLITLDTLLTTGEGPKSKSRGAGSTGSR